MEFHKISGVLLSGVVDLKGQDPQEFLEKALESRWPNATPGYLMENHRIEKVTYRPLPEGDCKYANRRLYTDVEPYEIIGMRGKRTYLLREMKVEKNPEWKPEFVPGGFSAICTNNAMQQWIIEPDPNGGMKELRLNKNGSLGGKYNVHTFSDVPIKHYDYNF